MFRWTVPALPSKDRTGEAVVVTVVVTVVVVVVVQRA